MLPSLIRLVTTLAAVLAAYFGYWLVAVPFIEPAIKQRVSEVGSPSISLSDAAQTIRELGLEHLFPPEAWELKNPKMLQTQHGMLLIRDYRVQEGGQLSIQPCTLIVFAAPHEGEGRRQGGVVLRAPQGAELRFDEAINLARGQFGRLQGGRLLGPVTIRSPESHPGAGNELDIRTGNVQITRERILAPNQVIFQYGQNSGSGRDLIINLATKHGGGAVPDRDRLETLGSIQSVELVHVERIHLQLDELRDFEVQGTRAQPTGVAASAEIDLTCRGPFRYDFARQEATFRDQVQVLRANAAGPADELICDLLRLTFGPRKGAGGEPSGVRGAVAEKLSASTAVDLRRVIFEGSPAVLTMPSYDAFVRADAFEYDLTAGQLTVRDRHRLRLRYQHHECEAKSLEYTPAGEGRLGQLLALGPGVLRGTLPNEPDKNFLATWQDRLIIQPHQGEQAISLISAAHLECPGTGEFSAERLHVWLREISPPVPAGSQPAKTRMKYQPTRLLAEGGVRVDSWQLAGQTQKAEVWIRDVATEEKTLPGPLGGHSGRSPLAGPAEGRAPQKFDVLGDHLQLQLIRQRQDLLVEHLILDGHVRFREIQTAKPDEVPLGVVADVVQVESAQSPQARIRIQGQPAEVAARGVFVNGDDIQLSRQQNMLWIVGPGKMTLPLAAARRLSGPGPPPAGGETAKMTAIWQGRMLFDGLVAKFERDVQLRGWQTSASGEVSNLLVTGSNLDVTMTRRVDFSSDQQPKDLDVALIAMKGQVFLHNVSSRLGMQTSLEQFHLRDLTIDQRTGRLQAYGPGWGCSSRLGSAMPSVIPVAATEPAMPAGGENLTYTRVDFEQDVVGNVRQHELQFRGRVRTLHGPVGGWDQTLDPDPPDGLASGVYLLTSDRLGLADAGGLAAEQGLSIEVVADGNAAVEGRDFTARGMRISYARAKDLLILEGDGRNDAELWRRGSLTPDAAAQQIRFWTHNNSIQVDGGRYLNLSQLGLLTR